ncbi:hypothetical protein ACIQMZ_19745 [Streptomyces longwoodensis]|uniref:hypothetical protein n=1 Tax=Streptomyces longwoodensis TaxID=68231 RepID=UPI0038035FD1
MTTYPSATGDTDLPIPTSVHRPETGWARARRLRRGRVAVRTCVPAVLESGAAPGTRGGAEWNIVRGDD